MDWPKELLDIFEMPDFVNVHPVRRVTRDQRIVLVFNEIQEWVEEHDGRLPEKSSNRKERSLRVQLESILADEGIRESLLEFDRLNILDIC